MMPGRTGFPIEHIAMHILHGITSAQPRGKQIRARCNRLLYPLVGGIPIAQPRSCYRRRYRRKLQIVHFNKLKPCNTPPEQCVQREATDHLLEEVAQQSQELRDGPDSMLEAHQPTRDGTGDTVDIEDKDENSLFGWDATNAFVPGTLLEEPAVDPAGVELVPVQIENVKSYDLHGT